MTNAELLAKIRQEIERRITDNTFGAKLELIDILAWLDTLESEKPMQDGLEEEINRTYHDGSVADTSDLDHVSYENITRHFYELGCRRTAEKYDEIEYNRQREEEDTPKDLEEAAGKSSTQYYQDAGYSPFPNVETAAHKSGFIAGAKWQAEQLLKSSPLPEDTVLFNKGVAEGRRLMMEELSDHIAAAYQLGLATHNPNIEPKVELIYTKDTTPADGKELLYVSDKSYKIGWRDCKEQLMKDGNVILTEEDLDAEKEKSMEWGYNLCKEQMMKEAVEGEILLTPYPTICLDDCKDYDFKDGQKVRIIIVKEDEK